MKEPQKNYYAIIPANVRYDENLIPNAKLLYGEITALCNEKGYCWASNDYFASLYKVSKTTIKKWLKSLESNGYIQREVKYKQGGKEIDTRWITIVAYPREEKLPTPREEKGPDNNTSFNTTSNNTKDIKDNVPFVEIINYLNQKTEKNFRNVESNKKLIRTRWNEGYRVDDFKKVIDNKSLEWLHNEKMNRYLQPSTLFGTKFDNYLNETPVIEKPVLSREEESYAGIDF